MEALTLELSLVAMVIVSGTFSCIDPISSVSGLTLSLIPYLQKKTSRHSWSLRLISERRDLNFSLRKLDALCFSFLRTEFFFVDEVYD